MENFDINEFKTDCQTLLTRAEKRIADLKEGTAKKLQPQFSDKFSVEDLDDTVNIIGTATGYAKIMKTMLDAHEQVDSLTLALYLGRHLAGSSRDTWSGRGNDLRRSVIDGEKQAARDIFDLIEYGSCLSL